MTGQPFDVEAVRADDRFIEDVIAGRTPGDDDLADQLVEWAGQ